MMGLTYVTKIILVKLTAFIALKLVQNSQIILENIDAKLSHILAARSVKSTNFVKINVQYLLNSNIVLTNALKKGV